MISIQLNKYPAICNACHEHADYYIHISDVKNILLCKKCMEDLIAKSNEQVER